MREDYGKLIAPNVEIQRRNFREMASLIGVKVQYQYPLADKDYTTRGELRTNYSVPEPVYCIFHEHVDQKTAKLLGWNAELQDKVSVISLPYDLHDLQIGCLLEVPSAFDDAPGRMFRVEEMSTIMLYPASVTCTIAPYFENKCEKAEVTNFKNSNFNLLWEGDLDENN